MNKLNYLITKLPNLPQHRKPIKTKQNPKGQNKSNNPKKKRKENNNISLINSTYTERDDFSDQEH